FLGDLFASNSVAQLAQRLPSGGGLYTYNAVSLGRQAGFVTGWMMTFAYILWVPSGIGATGTFFSQFFNDAFGWSINENILVVIFTGFESGAVLGEESMSPRRTIPRGIFGAVTLVGIFYLFVSYSEAQGVAPKAMADFAANPAELTYLTGIFWNSSWAWLIDL